MFYKHSQGLLKLRIGWREVKLEVNRGDKSQAWVVDVVHKERKDLYKENALTTSDNREEEWMKIPELLS